MSRNVVITANGLWYIANFRDALIRAIRDRRLVPVLIAPPGGLPRGAPADSVGQIDVPLDRSGTNPLKDLSVIAGYHRAFRRLRPLAVFSFTIKPNVYAALAGGMLGVLVMPTVTGLGTVFIKGGPLMAFVERLYRFAFKRCPVVFFENPQDLDFFVERRMVDISQARLVPGCGVDLQRFAVTPLPKDGFTFLLLARLLRDKGITEYIDAARLLHAEGIAADFRIVGPIDVGNRTAISREDMECWVAEGLIDYLGETNDVRPFIAAANAIVLPSYREGLPRALLEGAAMGRPLIATDVPGCRDVVDDGIGGVLCEVRSGPSLAAAMKQVFLLPREEQEAMGRAARAKVETQFDERAVVATYLDALDYHGQPKLAAEPARAHSVLRRGST